MHTPCLPFSTTTTPFSTTDTPFASPHFPGPAAGAAPSLATPGHPTGRRSQPTRLALVSGAYVLPHPDKVAKGGEDWYFIANNQRVIGIADGVGGWVSEQFDGGRLAWLLGGNECSGGRGGAWGCARGRER